MQILLICSCCLCIMRVFWYYSMYCWSLFSALLLRTLTLLVVSFPQRCINTQCGWAYTNTVALYWPSRLSVLLIKDVKCVLGSYQSAAGHNRLCGADHLALWHVPAGRIQLHSQTKCGYSSHRSPLGYVCLPSFGLFHCLLVALQLAVTIHNKRDQTRSWWMIIIMNKITKRDTGRKIIFIFIFITHFICT